ncbi:class I SAM-dependent methyltransferase [Flavobacterium sp.]|uniref:class I SAM-dependent methyltransferase n=1 Tax=Flavobacterium sp. TaxID=239 RepID=UPI0038D160D6
MKDFWNERYANKEYAYGVKPNEFYKSGLNLVPKGKLLFAAEGEGRNAVYAAQQGYEVYALDNSIEAKNKAEKLAADNNVKIDYLVSELENLDYTINSFDALVLVFAHFPASIRKQYHEKLLSFLKPNGLVIFEAFAKEQLNYNSGGPKQIEMLFSEEEIHDEFRNIYFIKLETVETNLDEGPYHQGNGKVVHFIGKKF